MGEHQVYIKRLNKPGISTGHLINREKLEMAKWMRQHMTYAERCFWNAVRKRRYPGLRFRRQQIIDGFIADFYCNKLNLVIEIDGGIHEAQKDYDELRDRIINDKGINIMRFKNEDVINKIDWVLKQIVGNVPTQPCPKALGEGERAGSCLQ
jgi:very-short-patch-repair endonuclease